MGDVSHAGSARTEFCEGDVDAVFAGPAADFRENRFAFVPDDELGAFFAAMAEDERPESVLFVIVTDGYENASRRFSNADVQRRVKLQAETYSWKFVFLAKGIDSEEAARDIGIDKNMAVFEDAVSDFSDGESVLYEMNERMANVRQNRRKK